VAALQEGANLRSLLTLRYEELFHAYYDQAVAGDTEATKIVVGIMERVAKINGVIPDRSLVTVDQRAMKFDQPVTFNVVAVLGVPGVGHAERHPLAVGGVAPPRVLGDDDEPGPREAAVALQRLAVRRPDQQSRMPPGRLGAIDVGP
jgi:hypothetical protein